MKLFKLNFSSKTSSTCSCEKYHPLELTRDEISKRVKESKSIKKSLELKSENSRQQLYQCPYCQQFWQNNWAWNWGNKEYLIKVPAIEIGDWKAESYMQPDEMLIYSASMSDYFEKNIFADSEKLCSKESCNRPALTTSVLCKDHFIQNLQDFNLLPKRPLGRLFEPYHFEDSDLKK